MTCGRRRRTPRSRRDERKRSPEEYEYGRCYCDPLGHAQAEQISQTARETTHALDEIVWTVNPSNDTLDGLVNYICKQAQDYLGDFGAHRQTVETEPGVYRRTELSGDGFTAFALATLLPGTGFDIHVAKMAE